MTLYQLRVLLELEFHGRCNLVFNTTTFEQLATLGYVDILDPTDFNSGVIMTVKGKQCIIDLKSFLGSK